jgi:multimeric flavodoxin WrbA
MHILTIQGSPRKRGNTATILAAFEKAVAQNHTVERIQAADLSVGGCLGCGHCQLDTGRPACIQEDDMAAVLQQILRADLVVYASPVYVWDFTSQMKVLLDRHYAFVKTSGEQEMSLVHGKQAMLLITCGGAASDNADLPFEIFDRECRYMQMRVMGKFVADCCGEPKDLADRVQSISTDMVRAISPQ